jgi:hypothetical protein
LIFVGLYRLRPGVRDALAIVKPEIRQNINKHLGFSETDRIEHATTPLVEDARVEWTHPVASWKEAPSGSPANGRIPTVILMIVRCSS